MAELRYDLERQVGGAGMAGRAAGRGGALSLFSFGMGAVSCYPRRAALTIMRAWTCTPGALQALPPACAASLSSPLVGLALLFAKAASTGPGGTPGIPV